jgi:hypothetical protein
VWLVGVKYYDNFGAEGARDDVSRSADVLDGLFIETAAIRSFLRGTTTPHVIVGSKGTGKTLLLFKKAISYRKKSGVIVLPESTYAHVPTLSFADARKWVPYAWGLTDDSGRPNLAQWGKLWQWALLSAVIKAWRKHISDSGDRKYLSEKLTELLDEKESDNPFLTIAGYFDQVESGAHHLKGMLRIPPVKPLLGFLNEYGRQFPPTCLFLDSQDEYYYDSPELWRAIGAGCYIALRELRHLSEQRVQVFLTLRPEVIAEISRSQHWPQWVHDFFLLRWQDNDLIELLRSRAGRLKADYLRSPELRREDSLGAFWGKELFCDKHRDWMIRVPRAESHGGARVYISLNQQLLRHSFRRPREMILLGNAILQARRDREPSIEAEQAVREAIDTTAATAIAQGYIAEMKSRWEWGEPKDDSIRNFITKYVTKNLLSHIEVEEIESKFAKKIGKPREDVTPIRRMATMGLVGWPKESMSSSERLQYFALPDGDEIPTIPADVRWFLVHPILYDSPFFVRVVPGLLVGQGLGFPDDEVVERLDYQSCFICYGKPEEKKARRMFNALRGVGVPCWLYPESAVPGKPVWKQIRQKLDTAERWLVLCSERSLTREGVLRELEHMIDIDAQRIIPLSMDDRWHTDEFQIQIGTRNLKPFLEELAPVHYRPRGRAFNEMVSEIARVLKRLPGN